MARIAGKLTDAVDVVANSLQRHVRLGHAAHIIRHDHPDVESVADDAAARADLFRLVIGELALMRRQREIVVMAGEQSAAEKVHDLVEAPVG